MLAVYLVLLLLPLISAQIYSRGPCPCLAVQPNFHIEKYLGKWYEIEKLPTSFARGKCIEANYSLRKDGTIEALHSQFYPPLDHPDGLWSTVDGPGHVLVYAGKGKFSTAEGTLVIRDMKEKAKLGVSFSYFTQYSPYWVLTTDYTNLAVVYSCKDYFGLFRAEFAWILSRSRSLPPKTVCYAKELLAKEGIDITRLKATDQNCKDIC